MKRTFAWAALFILTACGSSHKLTPESVPQNEKPEVFTKAWSCKDMNENPRFNTVVMNYAFASRYDKKTNQESHTDHFIVTVGDKDENYRHYESRQVTINGEAQPKEPGYGSSDGERILVNWVYGPSHLIVTITEMASGEKTELTCDPNSDELAIPRRERDERDRKLIVRTAFCGDENLHGAYGDTKSFFKFGVDGSIHRDRLNAANKQREIQDGQWTLENRNLILRFANETRIYEPAFYLNADVIETLRLNAATVVESLRLEPCVHPF